jgi:inner membrane protein
MAFDRFDRGTSLQASVQGLDSFARVAHFSRGFYALRQDGSRVLLSDLRMGTEPHYNFTFVIAQRHGSLQPLQPPQQVGSRGDVGRTLRWMWLRARGERLPPPRS